MKQKDSKQKYQEFCDENMLRIYYQPWWLDVVCCGSINWYPLLHEVNGKVLAAHPLYVTKIAGTFKAIQMPKFTQILGPVTLDLSNISAAKRYSTEKTIYSDLISQLPDFGYFIQSFGHDFHNWLPYYWHDFTQSTKYTYVVPDITNMEKVKANFSQGKRKNINKSLPLVNVRFDLPPHVFYEHHVMTLKATGRKINYSYELFKEMHDACLAHEAGRIIWAEDKANGAIHAALFLIWDATSGYDLISTIDPKLINSGSTSLLVYEGIRFLSEKTRKFDFEGSMIETVEASFRQFGAVQVPYFTIKKTRSKLLRLAEYGRSVFRP